MSTALAIGVDIGTQSTKAVLIDADGRIVAQASRGYRPDTPRPLWAQQDPQVWLDAVEHCIAAVVQQANGRQANGPQSNAPQSNAPQSNGQCDRIVALCVSSLYGGSGIPVDEAGQVLYPCLIWMDRRADAQVAQIRRDVDVDRLMRITGNGVDSYYGFTKMLWLRDNEPQVWSRIHHLLPPNAWVNAQLTGEVAIDRSSAGNIGGVYDLARRDWSDESMRMLGIPRRMMPDRLVESSDVVGGLTARWAQRLGLRAGLPCMAGGVDAAVATLAAGAARPGNHVAMIGTSMCWGTIRRSVDARHGLISMPHVFQSSSASSDRGSDPGCDLYVFGGAITAGASVTWFRDVIGEADVTAARERGEDSFAAMERAAASLRPGADGLLFLPYLMGERSPVWDSQASGCFIGLNLAHRRPHLLRAVLEGVSYALQHNIEAGIRGAGMLDERIVVVGGASHSDLWMQIIADVTNRPVFTIREDVEAALGAAVLAGHGAGLFDDARVQQGLVVPHLRAEPDPQRAGAYRDLFAQYVAAYPALKDVMHALSQHAR